MVIVVAVVVVLLLLLLLLQHSASDAPATAISADAMTARPATTNLSIHYCTYVKLRIDAKASKISMHTPLQTV